MNKTQLGGPAGRARPSQGQAVHLPSWPDEPPGKGRFQKMEICYFVKLGRSRRQKRRKNLLVLFKYILSVFFQSVFF